MSFDLDQWERWVFEVIRHPEGVEGGLEAARGLMPPGGEALEAHVIPSEQRTAAERLGVYANMYFWRLVDILRDEHPALDYALGDDFYPRMVQYLAAHPSGHYRLAPLGRHLPVWCETEAADDLPNREFLADLAALERLKEEVFDEEPAEVASADSFLELTPDQWETTQLPTVPAFRLLATRYPVNPYFQAVLNEENPEIPAAEDAWCVIWRQDWTIWRSNLTRPRYTLLKALSEGATLADALYACLDVPGVEPEALLANVGQWFSDWMSDGMFAGKAE